MKKLFFLFIIVLCTPISSSAGTYIYTIINSPQFLFGGETMSSKLTAINNKGQIGGNFSLADRNIYGFMADDHNFTPITHNPDTQGYTEVVSINDKGLVLVGYQKSGPFVTPEYYLFEDDELKPFKSLPYNPAFEPEPEPHAVNNYNHFTLRKPVGWPARSIDAYIYDYNNQAPLQKVDIEVEGEKLKYVYLTGINDFDVAVGIFSSFSDFPYRLFVFYNNEYIFYDLPDHENCFILNTTKINNHNMISGNFDDKSLKKNRPFILDLTQMTMSAMAPETNLRLSFLDINDAGQLVGEFGTDSGFLATPYYMDSDHDADSDGADMASLAHDFVNGTADSDDLVNFSQNFGRNDHYFTQFFYYLDPDNDQDTDGSDLAFLAEDLKNKQVDAGCLLNFAQNFGRTSNLFQLVPAQ